MIILNVMLRCDACSKEVPTTIKNGNLERPDGWTEQRWTPGVVQRPWKDPRAGRQTHVCSVECQKIIDARNKEENKKIEEFWRKQDTGDDS